MKEISTAELIYSDETIRDMRKVVGDDLILKIYISPGNEPHTAWNDEVHKDIKTKARSPAGWQHLSRVHFQE